PPASLNFLSLAASAPASPDLNSGLLLGIFPTLGGCLCIQEGRNPAFNLLVDSTPPSACHRFYEYAASRSGLLAHMPARPPPQQGRSLSTPQNQPLPPSLL